MNDYGKYLVKSAFVPELLKEFLLALGFFVPQFLCSFHIFLHPLFFRHSPSSFNLFPLLLSTHFILLLFLDSG